MRDAELCERARSRWHDTVRLSEFLDGLWSELETLYAEALPLDSLLPRRSTLLAAAAERFRRDYAPGMRTGFARFDAESLNNASLIARHLYYHRLPLFQALYERSGALTAAIERLTTALAGADEPWAALERLAEPAAGP